MSALARVTELPPLRSLRALPPLPGRGRLVARLLAFNLLLVFVPIAGLLLLGPYERQLLESQERAMVRQGRLLAAALAAGGALDAPSATRLLAELGRRSESRLRVVDRDGRPLADSSLLGPRQTAAAPAGRESEPAAAARPRRGRLYALGALPFALWQRIDPAEGPEPAPAAEYYGTAERLRGPELDAAFAGRYGATTRISPGPERAVILYSALPVAIGGEVAGAVLVSQSTARILGQLDEVRLAIFRVFLVSVAVAIVLSVFFAGTVARPLRALAGEARALVDGRGRLRGRFRGSLRRDEIGELARAFDEMADRLQRLVEGQRELLANVSHELRTPLARLRVTLGLAAESEPAEAARRLKEAEADLEELERLVGDVLAAARLDATGGFGLRREPLEAAELLERAAARFRRLHPQRVLELDAASGALRLDADPRLLDRVLDNLLDNAAKYSDSSSAIELSLAEAEGGAAIAVRDRGIGIAAADLERVFTPFFRGDRSRARDTGGAGLGLALSRRIVAAHGGRIALESRPGEGTTVRVLLPAKAASQDRPIP
jgi:signal transduction histidine kinase